MSDILTAWGVNSKIENAKGTANGLAPLDANSKIASKYLPNTGKTYNITSTDVANSGSSLTITQTGFTETLQSNDILWIETLDIKIILSYKDTTNYIIGIGYGNEGNTYHTIVIQSETTLSIIISPIVDKDCLLNDYNITLRDWVKSQIGDSSTYRINIDTTANQSDDTINGITRYRCTAADDVSIYQAGNKLQFLQSNNVKYEITIDSAEHLTTRHTFTGVTTDSKNPLFVQLTKNTNDSSCNLVLYELITRDAFNEWTSSYVATDEVQTMIDEAIEKKTKPLVFGYVFDEPKSPILQNTTVPGNYSIVYNKGYKRFFAVVSSGLGSSATEKWYGRWPNDTDYGTVYGTNPTTVANGGITPYDNRMYLDNTTSNLYVKIPDEADLIAITTAAS